MTFPIELHLGRETIGLHVLFETLGFFLGFRYFLYLRKGRPDPIKDGNRVWIIIGATFGAFLFSRLLGALENPPSLLQSQHPLLYLYANKTIVGGLLGGLLFVEGTKKLLGETQSSGDLFTYPLILAMIIGRIGCFTSGLGEETYGLPTSSFLGIDLGDGLPRHPVTLYEIVFLGLLWLGLVMLERRVVLKSTSSSPTHGRHRTLQEIETMLDAIVASEGSPDVVQLSGGEPTIHPDFFAILDLAKARPIKHLMVNTNGIRLANDRDFVARLAAYMPDFEVYLQFDSFKPEALQKLRGRDLTEVRRKALGHLNEFNLSTTLVVTLQRGVNDDEVGAIIEYALRQRCVRGVTFQPTQISGRLENFDPATGKLTPTEVRQQILEQTSIFRPNDLIPVPCNPDALTMAYALKLGGQVQPLTGLIDPEVLLNSSKNTIVYEQDEALHGHVMKMFSTGNSPLSATQTFNQLLCCLPEVYAEGLTYNNLFRVIIMNFMDAYDFDVRAIKKSCVHIVEPDGRIIPFETMNLFYRPEFREKLEKFRQHAII